MKELLFEWNPWWSQKYLFEGIKRDTLEKITPWIPRKEIIAILGVRRSGKTTLLYEVVDYLITKKNVKPENILFVKADDDRITDQPILDKALDEQGQWLHPQGPIFLFIDEIQEINNWQKTLKRLYDLRRDIKIFISGSNASLLKEDVSSSLAGRAAYFELFPFSFREFLRAKGVEIQGETQALKKKSQIRHQLLEYLRFGAFPEVVLEREEVLKKELVGFYFDSIFYRDIIKRRGIRNPAKMEKLVKYHLQNIATLANFTKIGKLLELTTDSVGEYTNALEDAYLVFPINLLEFSYKKQIINPKKIYCVDGGIRNIVGFQFSEDAGRLYENLVFVALRSMGKKIYYWKGKVECDFLVKEGKTLQAIQVCYDLKGCREREQRGLLEALHHFSLKTGTIITEDFESQERIEGRILSFVPLWKWLLEPTAI